MHDNATEPLAPIRWRYVPAVMTVMLLIAWMSMGLAWLARPVTVSSLPAAPLDYRVHVNDDDAIRLQLLPGIGPRLAEHLLAHREQVGRFDSHDALEQVHRIGPRTVERIEPWITLAPLPRPEPAP